MLNLIGTHSYGRGRRRLPTGALRGLLRNSTTPLGWLALLRSLGLTLGVDAMFSSAVELNVTTIFFPSIVFVKKVFLNGRAKAYVEKRIGKEGSLPVGLRRGQG